MSIEKAERNLKMDLFIGKVMHAPAFRDDVPNKLVTLLKAALLVGLVRITEENTCPAFSVFGDLNGPECVCVLKKYNK